MESLSNLISPLLNLSLSPQQELAFQSYEQELLEWNSRFNLTAIRDVQGIRIRHFFDSISCMLAWNGRTPSSLIDIGTGAGFPGIPLKIMLPDLHLTLVESVGKKAGFCSYISQVLNLENVTVLQARAEDLGQDPLYRERYDCAIARAVALMPILVEYLLPLVKIGGMMVAQKGSGAIAEIESARAAIRILGGKQGEIIHIDLPGTPDEHLLVMINKISKTPKNYPRHAGLPAKKPL